MTDGTLPGGGEFRSGFVAIAGPPNVGKSTLLNRMLGEKIAITSRKAQTTRNRILGVVHRPGAQMVFIDTPGIHKAEKALNVRMVETALSSLGDVDAVLFLIDAVQPDPGAEEMTAGALARLRIPVILVINKIDLLPKPRLLAIIDRWRQRADYRAIVPLSARHGDGVEQLMDTLAAELPEGPPYFPEDAVTDMPERFIAAEMIREKVFRFTGQEIPYSAAVTIDGFDESRADLIRIHATIHVERDSQKGIVIGKNGAKLRTIGEEARKEIERMVGTKVFLKLFVRVQKNWSRDTRALRKFGY
jgi:GTP-binding protein Era